MIKNKILNWLGVKQANVITIKITFEQDVPINLAKSIYERINELILELFKK